MKNLNFFKFASKKFTLNYSPKSLEKISKEFWKNKKPDLDSMCGFKELNEEDLINTKSIFTQLSTKEYKRALDVGSGIGRISFNFLYDIVEQIDLLDINKNFLQVAEEQQNKIGGNKIKNFYCSEIQKFRFDYNYDLVFIQWVLEYLNDSQLEIFIKNVYQNLENEGIIIIKENVNLDSNSNFVYPKEGSLIRNPKVFEKIFFDSGFKIKNKNSVVFKNVADLCDIKFWVLEKNILS
jgi:2-polyprenyl-3-methyl-5-hydroxy-6-metoxy-1,4-benzoquinol methylase